MIGTRERREELGEGGRKGMGKEGKARRGLGGKDGARAGRE